MRRRAFVLGAAGTLAGLRAACTQEAMPRLGLLSIVAVPEQPGVWAAFFERMRELGYEEGRNVSYLRRFAAGRAELFESMVRDVIAENPAVLVVTGAAEALTVQRMNPPMPCIMFLAADPVGTGLVPSLARPGGRFTGLSTMDLELDAKRLELLREAVPGLSRARLLTSGSRSSSNTRGAAFADSLKGLAESIGIAFDVAEAIGSDEIARAIADAASSGINGLLISFEAAYYARRREIAEAARRHGLPTIHGARDFVADGGLMSYSARVASLSRRAADFADRILRGTNPAALPVEQPTVFDLVVNLKTAAALHLRIPPTLLARADEVIE